MDFVPSTTAKNLAAAIGSLEDSQRIFEELLLLFGDKDSAKFRRGVENTLRKVFGKAQVHRLAVTPQVDTARLKEFTETSRHAHAVVYGACLLDHYRSNRSFLNQARKSFTKAGALSLQLEATNHLIAVEISKRPDRAKQLQRNARLLAGKIRELSIGWAPSYAGVPFEPLPGRILHVLKHSMPHRQSGYTMRSLYLVDSQRALGLDPIVVTAPGFPEEQPHDHVETINGTPYYRLPDTASRSDSGLDEKAQSYAERLGQLVSEIKPEVIHVHSGHRGYEATLPALAVGNASQIPVVYEVRGFFESLWSSDVDWNEWGETYSLRHERETYSMTQAGAVVTLGEAMKSDIVARGIPSGKVFVAPNGVDTEIFHRKARNRDLVAELHLENKFVFGYVSNLDHFREGHEYLISAAVELKRRGIDSKLLIIGDGKRRAELEDFAASLGAANNVVFTGKVPHDQVLEYYNLLDAFVIPRVDERAARLVTPLKPYEAMATEIPLIVSNLPALIEIIGNESRGWSFEAGDAGALVSTLIEVFENPLAARTKAEIARRWVEEEREWEKLGNFYAEIYKSVLGHDKTYARDAESGN